MRAKEFISEASGSIIPDVKRTLPAAWVIPELQNNDFYKQYRFGVALAGAKGAEQRKKDDVPEYSSTSAWGENEIVVSYAGKEPLEQYLDDALRQMGLPPSSAKLVSTDKSEEPTDTQKSSTLKPFKGYKR